MQIKIAIFRSIYYIKIRSMRVFSPWRLQVQIEREVRYVYLCIKPCIKGVPCLTNKEASYTNLMFVTLKINYDLLLSNSI
jgi:hypothetical protein